MAWEDAPSLLFCRRHWAGRGTYSEPGEPFFLKSEDPPWSRKVNSDRPSTQEEDTGSWSSTDRASKEGKEGLFSTMGSLLGSWDRDAEITSAPSSSRHSRGTSCSPELPERVHPKRTKQALWKQQGKSGDSFPFKHCSSKTGHGGLMNAANCETWGSV